MKFCCLILALLLLTSCDKAPSKDQQANQARAEARAREWAYVANEKQLSPNETLRLVRIPNSLFPGEGMFDEQCLIYVNKELVTSNMVCLHGSLSAEDPSPRP